MSRRRGSEPPSVPLSAAEEAYLRYAAAEPWSAWSSFTAEEVRALTWFDGWHAALAELAQVRGELETVMAVLACECEALTEGDGEEEPGAPLRLVHAGVVTGEEPTDKP